MLPERRSRLAFRRFRLRSVPQTARPKHLRLLFREADTASSSPGSEETRFWVAFPLLFRNWPICWRAATCYAFVRQSMRWAIAKKKPVIALWRTTFKQFLPSRTGGLSNGFQSSLADQRVLRAEQRFPWFSQPRIRLFGPLPSMQANLWSLDVLRRQFACTPLASQPAYEWRYPFMDRDLVSFCFSIPREQLVRPHQRRSLMRRALAGLVPREILERHRKAYVSRGLVNHAAAWGRLGGDKEFLLEELGIANGAMLNASIRDAEQGRDVSIISLLRTLTLEHWLRNSAARITTRKRPGNHTQQAGCHARGRTHDFLGREKLKQKGGDKP